MIDWTSHSWLLVTEFTLDGNTVIIAAVSGAEA